MVEHKTRCVPPGKKNTGESLVGETKWMLNYVGRGLNHCCFFWATSTPEISMFVCKNTRIRDPRALNAARTGGPREPAGRQTPPPRWWGTSRPLRSRAAPPQRVMSRGVLGLGAFWERWNHEHTTWGKWWFFDEHGRGVRPPPPPGKSESRRKK